MLDIVHQVDSWKYVEVHSSEREKINNFWESYNIFFFGTSKFSKKYDIVEKTY